MNSEDNIIQSLDLDRFFSEEGKNYDLLEGMASNACGTRIIYLPHDAIRGIHTALVDETGPAWKIILKNCGTIWGRRVAKNIDRELGLMFATDQGSLRTQEFIRLVEKYFSEHGWGLLKVDLSKAMKSGFIHVEMRNSIFAEVLEEETEMVDSMIAGMLRSIFEPHAGRELDAIEIACSRAGASHCEFVISAPERIEALEEDIEAGKSASDIIDSLSAA